MDTTVPAKNCCPRSLRLWTLCLHIMFYIVYSSQMDRGYIYVYVLNEIFFLFLNFCDWIWRVKWKELVLGFSDPPPTPPPRAGSRPWRDSVLGTRYSDRGSTGRDVSRRL